MESLRVRINLIVVVNSEQIGKVRLRRPKFGISCRAPNFVIPRAAFPVTTQQYPPKLSLIQPSYFPTFSYTSTLCEALHFICNICNILLRA